MEPYSIDKIYFLPGDKVTLKQDIPNKPTMIIVGKKTKTIRPKEGDKSDYFQGMICMWFSTLGEKQEAIFSTKDLIKLNN